MADSRCMKCKSRLLKCPTCEGKGITDQGNFFTIAYRPCPNCNGTCRLCSEHGCHHG